MNRKAMILAAGLGKRMRPLTDTLPKPLISVAGKTMLARAFDHLHDVGVTHIVVNTHYLPNLIEQAVLPGTLISREETLLETGGGIKKALPLLGEKAFFTMNGDGIWSDSKSLFEMDKIWDDFKMDALLLLIPRQRAHGYRGLGDFFLSKEGMLRRPEKGEEAPFVYIGIQLISPRLFADAPEGSFSLNTLWNKAIERGSLCGHVYEGDYFHISTPEELEKYEPMIEDV